VRTLLVSAGLALILHAILLSIEPIGLGTGRLGRPDIKTITFQLAHVRPLPPAFHSTSGLNNALRPIHRVALKASAPKASAPKAKKAVPKAETREKPKPKPEPVKRQRISKKSPSRTKKKDLPPKKIQKELSKKIKQTMETAMKPTPSDQSPSPTLHEDAQDVQNPFAGWSFENENLPQAPQNIGLLSPETAGKSQDEIPQGIGEKAGKALPEPVLREATPIYRRNPPPAYPRLARRRGYQGTVVLEVFVGEEGQVDDMKVFRSSGHPVLDKAAVRSVKDWVFEPGMRGQDPVAMWVRVPVRFQLK
jgi:protein TonB